MQAYWRASVPEIPTRGGRISASIGFAPLASVLQAASPSFATRFFQRHARVVESVTYRCDIKNYNRGRRNGTSSYSDRELV